MAFRREIDDRTWLMFSQQLGQQWSVSDIAVNKTMLWMILNRCKIFQIARVSQLIQVDHGANTSLYPAQHKIGADKARAASNQYFIDHAHHSPLLVIF